MLCRDYRPRATDPGIARNRAISNVISLAGTNYTGVSNEPKEESSMAKGAARPKGTQDDPHFRRLIFGLTPELDSALRRRAKEEDRPLAWIVRKALEEFLEAESGRPAA